MEICHPVSSMCITHREDSATLPGKMTHIKLIFVPHWLMLPSTYSEMLACSDEAHTLDSHGPGVESCLPHLIFLTFSFSVYKMSLKSDGLPIPRCCYKDSNKIMHVKFLICVTKSNSKHLHSIYHALRTISRTLYVLTLYIPTMIL